MHLSLLAIAALVSISAFAAPMPKHSLSDPHSVLYPRNPQPAEVSSSELPSVKTSEQVEWEAQMAKEKALWMEARSRVPDVHKKGNKFLCPFPSCENKQAIQQNVIAHYLNAHIFPDRTWTCTVNSSCPTKSSTRQGAGGHGKHTKSRKPTLPCRLRRIYSSDARKSRATTSRVKKEEQEVVLRR